VGLPARVRAGVKIFAGSVSGIRPAIEDGAARFDVSLDRPDDPRLRQNLRVDVMVVTEVRENVVRVPRGPFARSGSEQHVFVLEDGRAVRTDVRFGVSGIEHFEIASGLEAGQRIVLSDLHAYQHLARLEVKGVLQ
jgi:HlyD family secretion protein